MSSIDIILILDASGSMAHLIDDTIGGVNNFLEQQAKEPGQAFVTLTTFDTNVKRRWNAAPLHEGKVPKLDHSNYYNGHGGNTALLDAVGTEILHYEALPIKADKTMFVIDTDGAENSSMEWNFERVKDLILAKQKDGWAFIFLGANNSAWQGPAMGTSTVGQTVASSPGVAAKYANTTYNTSAMRRSNLTAGASSSGLNWNTGEGDKKSP